MNVTFDPVHHRYYAPDGIVLPSVTQIIGRWWPIDRSFFTEDGTQRGTDVHELTAGIDTGSIAPDTELDDEVRPYVEAWMNFVAMTGARILEVEKVVGHPIWRYAGTLDRLVEYQGRLQIWDLKTGPKASWHELQQSAYQVLAEEAGYSVESVACVHLSKTGKAKLETHDLMAGRRAWLLYLSAERYRKDKKKESWC